MYLYRKSIPVLLLVTALACSCTKNAEEDAVANTIADSVFYDFANWYVKKHQVSYLCEKADYMSFDGPAEEKRRFEESLSEVVGAQEKEVLMKQYHSLGDYYWKSRLMPNVKLISFEEYRSFTGAYEKWEKDGHKRIFLMSRPLITSDKKTLIVYIENNCPDCSWGGFEVFTKAEAGWKEVEHNFSTWIE